MWRFVWPDSDNEHGNAHEKLYRVLLQKNLRYHLSESAMGFKI